MRLISLVLPAAFLLSCNTNKNVFTSPDFETRVLRHQTIAILPVNIIQPDSKLKTAAEQYGYIFQEQLLLHLLNYTGKNKQGQTIAFQPIQKTNAFLTKNNINIEEAYKHKPDELAKMCEVDAVIMVTLTDEGNFTQGPAFGLSGGRNVYNSNNKNPDTLSLEIDPVHLNMDANLYDAIDGKLIWGTHRSGGTDLPLKIDALAQYYSNWIAKRFPYRT